MKYECPKCGKFSKFSEEETPNHNIFHACHSCGKIVFPWELDKFRKKGINEDAGTSSGDIAINPGAGGRKITKRVLPDGQHGGIDYFEVDVHNFNTASQAKVLKQRYNFTDSRVVDYLKQTNWTKTFYVKHKGNMVKVGKI
jgi:hypothetical protein